MNESQFSREIRKSLDKYGYFRKMIGGAFIVPGIPDILGCYRGRFISIECKLIKSKPKHANSILWNNLFSPAQIDNLQAIKDSGGLAYGIIYILFRQQAIALAPGAIRALNKAILSDIEGLILQRKITVLNRKYGVWDVEKLLTLNNT